MKKQLFSLVMMLALVIVAGSAMAQGTSITPFAGATYTYTVGGIDAGTTTRLAQISFKEAGGSSKAIGDATSISIGTTTTNPGAAANTSGTLSTPNWNITLPIGATSLTFNATFGASVALAESQIWIEIFNDAAGTECSNSMYLTVTPVANNLDFSIIATLPETCPTPETPTAQKTDAVANQTIITYTVSRIDGTPNYNWSFELALNDDMSLTETVVVSAGGTITPASGVYTIPGSLNSATVTVTITNAPGTNDATYAGTISNMKQYIGATTTLNSSANKLTTNDTDNTILLEVPSIGSFEGN